MAQERLQHARGQRLAIMTRRVDRGQIRQRDALGPAQRHHSARGQEPFDLRHHEARIVLRIGGELAGGGGFDPEVELLHHDAFEMLDHGPRPQPSGGRRDRLDHPGDQVKGVDILAKRPFDPGPQDLDGDRAFGPDQPGLVHLRDGGRRHRVRELGEQRAERFLHLVLDDTAGHVGGKRRQLVLQHLQLTRKAVAHHVGARRQDLAELDIGRAQRGQRARHRRHPGIAAQAKPLEGPAQHAGHDTDGRGRIHRLQHRAHRAGPLECRAGAHEPPDVVRAPHLRSSSPNAAPRSRTKGCDRRRARTRRRGSWRRMSPDRGTCGSIRRGTGNCRDPRRLPAPCAGSR